MKKIFSLLAFGLLSLAFFIPKSNADTAYVCCLSNSMQRCAVVMYPGPGGGEGISYPFDGLKVACPRIP